VVAAPLDEPLDEPLDDPLDDDPPLPLEDPAAPGPGTTACERVQGSLLYVTASPGVSTMVQITIATASWNGWKTWVAAAYAGIVFVATVDDST
jgi:hypothetical protein